MDRPDMEELRVHVQYNHTFGPLAQSELGKAIDYIEHLEKRLCERCHQVPWSLSQMLKCDECPEMEKDYSKVG